MHPYSHSPRSKAGIYLILATFSILAAELILHVLAQNGVTSLPWWSSVPSFTTIYWGLYTIFNRYIWKTKYVQAYRSYVGVPPNVEGCWQGTVSSSNGKDEKYQIEINVEQRWNEISISLRSNSSKSQSLTAHVDTSHPETLITYTYINTPRKDNVDTMTSHKGTAQLSLRNHRIRPDTLQGGYFNDNQRRTFGEIDVVRRY